MRGRSAIPTRVWPYINGRRASKVHSHAERGNEVNSDMLPGKRSVRVGDVILKEVAFLLLEKVRDPRVQGVTLTGVRLSDDLKLARIYYSVMGDQTRVENAQSGLNSATGFVKREIGRRAGLRYIPEIKFVYDPSLKTGDHMERVFEKMHKSE